MRFLGLVSLFLVYFSVPVTSLEGRVFVDEEGSFLLTEQKKEVGWHLPRRGYIFGQPLYFSLLTQESLEDLPGVGPSLAKKIMMLREENMHPKWSDIDEISGIGVKKLSLLKKHLILDE